MRLTIFQIILKKSLFGKYIAYYKDKEGTKVNRFAKNIEGVIYHGDMMAKIFPNKIVIRPLLPSHDLHVEYIEKDNKLVIDTIY